MEQYFYDFVVSDVNVNQDLSKKYEEGWEVAGDAKIIEFKNKYKILIPIKIKIERWNSNLESQ